MRLVSEELVRTRAEHDTHVRPSGNELDLVGRQIVSMHNQRSRRVRQSTQDVERPTARRQSLFRPRTERFQQLDEWTSAVSEEFQLLACLSQVYRNRGVKPLR